MRGSRKDPSDPAPRPAPSPGEDAAPEALWIDAAEGCLRRGDDRIWLKAKAFAVLRHLQAHAGHLVTSRALRAAVWPDVTVSPGVLKTAMWELRQAVGDVRHAPRFIQTVPRRGYRLLRAIPTAPRGARLVGREPILERLWSALRRALAGQRTVVFVTGEAGIGKTAVVDTFLQELATQPGVRAARGCCTPHQEAAEAYLPLLHAVGQLCRGPDGARTTAALRRYAPTWLVELPAAVTPRERARLRGRLGVVSRERMVRELAEVVELITTSDAPLVLVLEDVHWADPSTLDALTYLAARPEAARLLVVATHRPADGPALAPPAAAIVRELCARGHGVELALASLGGADVTEYLLGRFGEAGRDPRLVSWILPRTDGHPFFVVTLVEYLVTREALMRRDGRWQVVGGSLERLATEVPPSIGALIERQIEALPAPDQRLLEVASLIGLEFETPIVAAALAASARACEMRCDALAWQGSLIVPGDVAPSGDARVVARHRFRHVLCQQVLAARVSPARRALLHQRIGRALERAHGRRRGEVAAALARHFEAARDFPRAVRYLHLAGENAVRRAAYVEARALLERGLALATRLPGARTRLRAELAFRTALLTPLLVVEGYAPPAVGRSGARARAIARRLGDHDGLFLALGGLFSFHFNRAEIRKASRVAEEIQALARRGRDPAIHVWGPTMLGHVLVHAGAFARAETCLRRGLAAYAIHRRALHPSDFVQDPGVEARAALAFALWCRGRSEEARREGATALASARGLAHPPSLAFALGMVITVHAWRREWIEARALSEELIAVVAQHDLPHWRAASLLQQGWIAASEGRAVEGIERMCEAMAALRAMGTALALPGYAYYLAGAQQLTGRRDEALVTVREALALALATGEYLTLPGLHRLHGDLLAGGGDDDGAERALHTGLRLAARLRSPAFELWLVLSLAPLRLRQGKPKDAARLLLRALARFPGVEDGADIREARDLLQRVR